jgi:curved DNA-binding protein CbpA
MGNQGSKAAEKLPNDHITIYNKILQIKSPETRINMLRTVLSGPEFVQTAKQMGIYAGILEYIRGITYDEPGPHFLPGEARPPPQQQQQQPQRLATATSQRLQSHVTNGAPTTQQGAITVMHNGKAQKAKDYFNWSLEILGLTDSDGLTLEVIKQAYKKAAARAHPDRQGGSDKAFKDVTKASNYLVDIVSKITGRRPTDRGVVEEIKMERAQRQEDNDKWANFKPTKLDPKNLNMKAFNDVFEQTHMKDVDEDGYGDWLKAEEGSADIPKPMGEYNRDRFMQAFEDNVRKTGSQSTQNQIILNPNAMALVAPVGVELGRDRPAEYTAPFMSDVNYTDLRSAYTQHNTIMNHVANVKYEERSFDRYKSAYDAGPAKVSAQEAELLRQSEIDMEQRERQRQLRHAQQERMQLDNAERLRTLLISNGSLPAVAPESDKSQRRR